MYKFPALSTAISCGSWNRAPPFVPSLGPKTPGSPANVVTIPSGATLRTHGRGPRRTSPPFGSSTRTAGVDPRYDSLSRAYRIIVRPTKAEEPSGFHFAVTHVFGLFCNASAKYAQGLRPWRATRGTPIFRAALVQTGLRPPSTSFRVGNPTSCTCRPCWRGPGPRRVC